ncbi:hypothetical protein STEG23_005950, partial [Scotinomys teguina]
MYFTEDRFATIITIKEFFKQYKRKLCKPPNMVHLQQDFSLDVGYSLLLKAIQKTVPNRKFDCTVRCLSRVSADREIYNAKWYEKKPLSDGSSRQPCHMPQASSENKKEHSLMADSQSSKITKHCRCRLYGQPHTKLANTCWTLPGVTEAKNLETLGQTPVTYNK